MEAPAGSSKLSPDDVAYLASIADITVDMKSFDEILVLAKGCPDPERYSEEAPGGNLTGAAQDRPGPFGAGANVVRVAPPLSDCEAGAGFFTCEKDDQSSGTMTLHGVTCERVQPLAPEAYICAWADRNKLVLGLLSEGKGTRTSRRDAIEGAPGIVGRTFAVVEVES